jgi:hypothetical protein
VSDEHQIPWGMPGPDDPVERAWATALRRDGDQYTRVRPIEWPDDGVEDPESDMDGRP